MRVGFLRVAWVEVGQGMAKVCWVKVRPRVTRVLRMQMGMGVAGVAGVPVRHGQARVSRVQMWLSMGRVEVRVWRVIPSSSVLSVRPGGLLIRNSNRNAVLLGCCTC